MVKLDVDEVVLHAGREESDNEVERLAENGKQYQIINRRLSKLSRPCTGNMKITDP